MPDGDAHKQNESFEPAARRRTSSRSNVFVWLLLAASLGLSGYKAATAPITFDEAYTYLRFARQPVGGILSDYSYPNNHILHTLLVKTSTAIFGNAPWALRLPAWLGGAALLAGLFAVGRKATPRLCGMVVVAAGFLPIVIDYNALARGYSLGAAACMWAIWVALTLDASQSNLTPRRRFFSATLFGGLLGTAIGFIPTYAIFTTAIVLAALLSRFVSKRNIGIAILSRDTVALLLGAGAVIGITYARIRMKPGSWPWGYETAGACNDAFWQRAIALPANVPDYLPTTLLVLLLVISMLTVIVAAWRRQPHAALFIALLPICAITVLAVLEATVVSKWPFARSLLLLAPLALLPFGFAPNVQPLWLRRITQTIFFTATAALIVHTLLNFDPIHYPEWRDNAGVPAAVAAIEADLPQGTDAELHIAHPWPLDVCLEYTFLRQGHPNWKLVPADDPQAPYRILRTGEKRRADRKVIHHDRTHGIRVTRRIED